MSKQRMRPGQALRYVAIFSVLLAALLPFSATAVQAGREGVFIGDNTYFALSNVTLTPGADNQTLRFGVDLVNGSSQNIDFNQYGVRVVDTSGNSYGGTITEQAVARVAPNQTTTFTYMAQIPNGVAADQLKVDVFAWDFSTSSYMDDLGMLSVGSLVQMSTIARQTVILNMNDIDASYANDALVSFQLLRSYKALSGGTWSLYSDIVAENMSGSSLKLPSSLLFLLQDSNGLTYSAAPVYGGDQTILPHQRVMLSMQGAIGNADDHASFTLQFVKKTGGSTTSANGTSGSGNGGNANNSNANNSNANNSNNASSNTASSSTSNLVYTTLGKLDLSRSVQLDGVGESASYDSKDAATLTLTVSKEAAVRKSDGTHVSTTFTISNASPVTLAVPNVNASLQLTGSTLSVPATESASASHPAYLASGDSTSYQWNGVLPEGVDPSVVQLAVFEKKPGTPAVSVPIKIVQLPAGSDTGNSADPGSVSTSAGDLSIQLKSTYRLLTETGDDVLMSEVTIQNMDSSIISLPSAASFYGGFMLGDFDAQGKAIRLQTSPDLSPGQKTTVYVYSKVPYSTAVDSGYVYLGDGTFSNQSQSWTSKNEWIELPFTSVSGQPTTATLNTPWFIADSGRMSTAQIVESKTYDNSNGQKLVAIRVQQTNQETRGGANVPYIGYVTDANGSVWSLKATEDAGTLCKSCQALTTLWATVPANSVASGGLKVVFGEKVDDTAFATAQQYIYADSTDSSSVSGSSLTNASLFPYTVSVQNAKWTSGVQSGSPIVNVTFDYTQTKSVDMTGITKDRNLEFALIDANNNAFGKPADYPLEGTLTGAGGSVINPLTSGSNDKLTFSITNDQLVSFVSSPRLGVYEKFENGLRLIGAISLSN